jgi:hypothetical protein
MSVPSLAVEDTLYFHQLTLHLGIFVVQYFNICLMTNVKINCHLKFFNIAKYNHTVTWGILKFKTVSTFSS